MSTVIGKACIGEPGVGCTQTFITIGAFDTRAEAENCNKYINTKFACVMLAILKATQHNAPDVWSKIPLQDFTPNSDIDWSRPIWEIDEQLYHKYGLTDDEINFIERHIECRDEVL